MKYAIDETELARLEELAKHVLLPFETVMEYGVGCPSGIQTTATTYAHVTPGGQKRAAGLLPSFVQFGAEKSPHDDS